MKFTYVNIKDIISNQLSILREDNHNKFVFLWLPMILGFILSLLFLKDSSSILDILTLFLSIFIPIFLSLLATLISFVMNKIKTRLNGVRIPLIKQSFYNICYLIPISMALLILSLFMKLTWFNGWIIGNISFNVQQHQFDYGISINTIYIFIIGIIFYGGIVHLIMNILMVTKRIYKLFDKEIDIITNPESTNEDEKSVSLIAMLIGVGEKNLAKEKLIDYILSNKDVIKAFNMNKEDFKKSLLFYSNLMKEVGITDSDIERAYECRKRT